MSSVSERAGGLFRARIECILQRDGKERERERKGSSALRERGSEKHKRRDPSAGKKAIKIVSLFFWLPHFFLRSLFFGKAGQKGKEGAGGGGGWS